MSGRRRIPGLSLYHFEGCPWCTRVRTALDRLGIEVELRDVQNEPTRRAELIGATGRATVPCLRIEDANGARWMHESADIIRWLEGRYGSPEASPG
jgi:glutathione S-transferase